MTNTANVSALASLNLGAMVALHNDAIADYGVAVDMVKSFKSKAKALEAFEALCAAGNLAIIGEGEDARIVDATPSIEVNSGEGQSDEGGEGQSDEGGEGQSDEGGEGQSDEGGEGQSDEGGDTAVGAELSDGKGEIARSGFRYGSREWLEANPRGTAAREAYRKARKKTAKAARKARHAVIEAKHAALNEA